MSVLRARWLGRVPYQEADDLQRAILARAADDYLLLLEHPHVYTLGTRAGALEHVLVPPGRVGAELVRTDRGGDVTYHGPEQLVGYPIVTLPEWRDGRHDVVAYVRRLEAVLVDALRELGVDAHRADGFTGVWVGDAKIGAIGVKVVRGRTRHGFAVNVDPDLTMFDHIVPCGITDKTVTSVAAVLDAPRRVGSKSQSRTEKTTQRAEVPGMKHVVDTVLTHFARHFPYDEVDRQDVAWKSRSAFAGVGGVARPLPDGAGARAEPLLAAPPGLLGSSSRVSAHPAQVSGERPPTPPSPVTSHEAPVRLLGRLADAGVEVPEEEPGFRRPPWMKVRADLGPGYRETKRLMRSLDLHTVCEEAGCPNIYECWADKTATFMILGDRCTRACGFCLVDTRHPLELDVDEPERVADAVATLGLEHAVVTSVARDDVPDGGAGIFAGTIRAIRARTPNTRVEVLIPDCKGDPHALATIFAAGPDVLNHNLETVARLQRAARPSAAYARSLTLLARAKDAGLTTKSGIILGMGETEAELRGAISDLRNVGVDILTLGQYLRPSARHLPVVRWWEPAEFDALGAYAESLGFAHVEAGPLVRSSYHAKRAVEAAEGAPAMVEAR